MSKIKIAMTTEQVHKISLELMEEFGHNKKYGLICQPKLAKAVFEISFVPFNKFNKLQNAITKVLKTKAK